MAQLVEALRYKQEDYEFNFRFFFDLILPATIGHWVDSASNRNEYQKHLLGGKGGRCVGLTPSLTDCLEILKVSISWSPKGLYDPVMG